LETPRSLVARLEAEAPSRTPQERLKALRAALEGSIVFTTGFGAEDQAITHMIASEGLDIEFAAIDTGRLSPQTYDVWAATEARYGISIRPFFPQADELEDLVSAQGVNGFYRSIKARKACCAVRIAEPLSFALAEAEGWVTGARADQAAHHRGQGVFSLDEDRKLVKLNPLFDWTRADALAFAKKHDVPLHPLHAQGFASIGCASCTRAISRDEPEGAGLWWWEDEAMNRRDQQATPGPSHSRAI
jgi:phosphoadenosine phosphosulfate reductase